MRTLILALAALLMFPGCDQSAAAEPPPPGPAPDTHTSPDTPPSTPPAIFASYGTIRTVAGLGKLRQKGESGWRPEFEGGPGLQAELSRPHMAMADAAGNIYIADKDAHAIRKLTLAGTIHTVAGTGTTGDDGDTPGLGTERRLASPNGLWVTPEGVVYILDLGNGKIRRLDKAGQLTTVLTSPKGISLGRGLWVDDDGQRIVFASGNKVEIWTPSTGQKTLASGFSSLGNLARAPDGTLLVTDRGQGKLFRIDDNGQVDHIAGSGARTAPPPTPTRALQTPLHGVRGVYPLQDGGTFLATHEGSQVFYLSPTSELHLFVDGRDDHTHAGDGHLFSAPGPKISEARSVTVDTKGNVIICENDYGFIRIVDRIQ